MLGCVCFFFFLLDFSSALYEMCFKELERLETFRSFFSTSITDSFMRLEQRLSRLEHLLFFRESGSVPSTHVGCLTTVFSSSFQRPSALFWSSWAHEHMRLCTHIYIHILIYLKVFSSSFQGPSALFWPSWAHEHMSMNTHIHKYFNLFIRFFCCCFAFWCVCLFAYVCI